MLLDSRREDRTGSFEQLGPSFESERFPGGLSGPSSVDYSLDLIGWRNGDLAHDFSCRGVY
jgi:hypothetical protein